MRTRVVAAFAVLGLSLALMGAQEAEEADVRVAESEKYGPHLVDAEGNSLYLYSKDEDADGSACVDRCAENWPALTVEGEPQAGEGIDPELLGTIERDDGSRQVTYNGWPLYRYVRDREPGQTYGHGVGDLLFLVTPEGEPAEEQAAATGDEVSEEVVANLMQEGANLFASNCSACHGAQGQGVVGPALDGYDYVGRTRPFINTIILGRPEHGMPAFGERLDDRQIAAIATYVRNSWSNEFGAVTEEEVAAVR